MRYKKLLLPTLFKSQPSLKMSKFNILIFCCLLLFGACKDQKADIPTYIKIDDISLNITSIDQGTSGDAITDAYVYINDNLIGIYELPAEFPLLQEGKVKVSVRAGIKQNGISNSRLVYPFYTVFDQNVNLIPGQTITLNPVVEYKSNTIFSTFSEDFETGINFVVNTNSDTIFSRINDPDTAFEGYCGAVFLKGLNNAFEAYTPTLPNLTVPFITPVYLELNFKGNILINVGTYYNNKLDKIPYVVLPVKNDWTKIYINIGELMQIYRSSNEFNIFFGFGNGKNDKAQFYIDNVKLIHF